jgi:hypothetical protein
VTLVLELLVPLAFFAPRPARLGAAVMLTGFQLVNAATANYGFFCWLALALHVFLLDDTDVTRAHSWLRRRSARVGRAFRAARVAVCSARRRLRRRLRRLVILPAWRGALPQRMGAVATAMVVVAYLAVSGALALERFEKSSIGVDDLGPLAILARPLRLVNTYHLFSQITRDRIEPEVQTSDVDDEHADPSNPDGSWSAHHLRYKPGDPQRRPRFVAPHQPRLDFQLWFYGLSMRRGAPPYVTTLLDRVCNDPGAVEPLFAAPLPEAPARARIAFWRYRFSSSDQRRDTGAWWTREPIGATRPLPCRLHAGRGGG